MPTTSVLSTSGNAFGKLLRTHRTHRGWSQEKLAEEAEISPRHLSCLENGKSTPSRTMALVLGSALDLPLRDRNAMLEAAGFAAVYRDAPLEAPEAAALRRAGCNKHSSSGVRVSRHSLPAEETRYHEATGSAGNAAARWGGARALLCR